MRSPSNNEELNEQIRNLYNDAKALIQMSEKAKEKYASSSMINALLRLSAQVCTQWIFLGKVISEKYPEVLRQFRSDEGNLITVIYDHPAAKDLENLAKLVQAAICHDTGGE